MVHGIRSIALHGGRPDCAQRKHRAYRCSMIDRQDSDFFRRRRRMTEHASPDAAPNTTDLFEIMRTAAVFRTASWSYRIAHGRAARNRSGRRPPNPA
jgi:hypothetical protein